MAASGHDDELERFKTQINLTEYAAACEFQVDRKASSRNSITMKHPDGSKIIVTRGTDHHWTYFSVHDISNSGSIIDFVQRRRDCNLGHVRQELRPWIGGSKIPFDRPAPDLFVQQIEPSAKDLVAVTNAFKQTTPINGKHKYLETERCISTTTLSDPIFANCIHIDFRSNAIFPHYDRSGLCGFEIKNRGFTGFSKGGEKGVWYSRPRPTDICLVIAETAIDALSYAGLHGTAESRFLSVAGQLNPMQPDLLQSAMDKMPPGSEIIAAVDHDDAGLKLAEKFEELYHELPACECPFRLATPAEFGDDWNDVLCSQSSDDRAAPDVS